MGARTWADNCIGGMLICMRTTLDLDDDVLREAKQLAAATGTTVTSLIEDALRALLTRHLEAMPVAAELPVFRGGRGARPGVDLADTAALEDLMNDGPG